MRNLTSVITSNSFISVEKELDKTLLILVFALINLFGLNLYAQVQYGAAANFGLRKVVPTYTGSAIQVRRECDNATKNIGFSSCGTLDTTVLKNFVLSSNPLSAISSTYDAAYSLRKLRCAFAGNAIKVRRSCDNVTKDIGFTSTGDLDTVALKSFVMASNPISALSVSAAVAYGLRKLRCAYAGSAIRVRRSSDNATSDIGFTTLGDLDTTSLKTFVGAGNNGFVTIWYDQSGNSVNVSPPAATNQPKIINAGVVNRKNGIPTILFDGIDDYFTTNSFSTTGYTGFTANIIASWTAIGATTATIQALIDNDHNCTRGFVFQDRPDLVNKPATLGMPNASICQTVDDGITTGNGSLRILSYVNNTTTETGYRDGTSFASRSYSGAYVIGTRFMIGAWYNSGTIARFTSGNISEVTIFKSALSTSERQYLEWGQSQYFSVTGPSFSSTLPAGSPSAFIATWYDQSINGYNLTAATATQPIIMSAGVIQRANGNASVYFNGVNTSMTNTSYSLSLNSQSPTWNAVIYPVATNGAYSSIVSWRSGGICSQLEISGSNKWNVCWWSNSIWSTSNGIVVSNGSYKILTSLIQATASQMYVNGTLSYNNTGQTNPAAAAGNTTPLVVGSDAGSAGRYLKGYLNEIVLSSTNMSTTDRQYLEWSQATYYGISGPTFATAPASLPNAYITKWYDQSNNGNDLTAAVASQPIIVSSGIIKRQGSLPAIKLDGTSSYMTQSSISISNPYTANAVATRTANGGCCGGYQRLLNMSATGESYGYLGVLSGNYATFAGNGAGTWNDVIANSPNTSVTLNTQAILSMAVSTGATGLVPYLNGTAQTAKVGTAATATGFIVGATYNASSNNQLWTGNISEFNIFSSALSTTRRTLIETNQSAFYSITVSNSKYTPPTSSSYIYYVNGIGRESATDSIAATRQSSGMGFSVGTAASDFLKDNGDYLTCGMDCPITATISVSNLPATVIQRWFNDWYLNKTDVGTNNGQATVYFDFSDYGVGATPGVASNYVLLCRSSPSGTFTIVPGTTPSISGDQVRFAVNASNITTNFYYTIGTLNPTTSPLPIELLNFSGKCDGNATTLKWSTATETNNDFFTIERSIDGINYEILGAVNGAGNSLQILNYSYIDVTPFVGTSYYRLKQTDFDGQFEYSEIIAVQCNNEMLEVMVYPNPVTNELTIETPANNESVNFEIINSMGAVIYYGSFIQKTTVQTSGFAAGIYVIKFANACNFEFKKVIKQ